MSDLLIIYSDVTNVPGGRPQSAFDQNRPLEQSRTYTLTCLELISPGPYELQIGPFSVILYMT